MKIFDEGVDGKKYFRTGKDTGIPKGNFIIGIVLLISIIAIGVYFYISHLDDAAKLYQDISNALDDPIYGKNLGCDRLRVLTQMDDRSSLFNTPVMNPPPPKELMDKIFKTMKENKCQTYEELKTKEPGTK